MNDTDIEVKDMSDTDGDTDAVAVANLTAVDSEGEDTCRLTPQITAKHKTPLLCSNKVHDSQSCVRTTTCKTTVLQQLKHDLKNTSNNERPQSTLVTVSVGKVGNDPKSSVAGCGGDQDKLKKEAWKRSEPSIKMLSGKLSISFVAGFFFGMSIQKGAVYEPRVIRAQFIYEKFIMMKMFLSAVAFGVLCLAILSVLPFTKEAFERAHRAYAACLTRKGVVSVLTGGFLLGAGMTVSGACPGMVLVQVGAWVGHGRALMTLFGCLLGAFAFGLVEPYLAKIFVPKKPYEKQAVVHWIKLPFAVFAVAMAIVTAAIVFLLEWFFPWKEELFVPNTSVGWFYQLLAWPPYVAGILIGAMQIPIVLAVGDTLGGSSSYCTIVSQLLVTKSMESKVPYLASFKRGLGNWWQVFYICGAIFGGCMSAYASSSLGSVPGVSLQSSFIGGFLMVFGARLAGGCTSGHGLSGVGLLMVLSMLASAAMFAGGTIVGFVCLAMDKANLIDYYTF